MQMFYSAAMNGFYSREVHGDNMPEDAKEISAELYDSRRGRYVVPDANGLPALYEASAAP